MDTLDGPLALDWDEFDAGSHAVIQSETGLVVSSRSHAAVANISFNDETPWLMNRAKAAGDLL